MFFGHKHDSDHHQHCTMQQPSYHCTSRLCTESICYSNRSGLNLQQSSTDEITRPTVPECRQRRVAVLKLIIGAEGDFGGRALLGTPMSAFNWQGGLYDFLLVFYSDLMTRWNRCRVVSCPTEQEQEERRSQGRLSLEAVALRG